MIPTASEAWLRKKNGERIPLEVVYRAEETDNA